MRDSRPIWRFGRTSSFGVWFRSRPNGKLLVLFWAGAIFSRETTVVYRITEKAEDASEDSPPVDVEFKQRIKPSLTVTEKCGALLSKSDFPMVVFASGSDVVYSGDDLKTFKRLQKIPGRMFFNLSSLGHDEAESFVLPDLDPEIYETGDDEDEDDTKKGLLIPICRISVKQDQLGRLRAWDVLDILRNDTLAFEAGEDEDEDEESEEPDNPCKPHEGDGAGAGGGGAGESGGGGAGAGGGAADEPAGEGSVKPCD